MLKALCCKLRSIGYLLPAKDQRHIPPYMRLATRALVLALVGSDLLAARRSPSDLEADTGGNSS